jgi:hypothetical protein
VWTNATFVNITLANNTYALPRDAAGGGTVALASPAEPLARTSLWLLNCRFTQDEQPSTGAAAAASRRLLRVLSASATAPAPPQQIAPVATDDTVARPVFSNTGGPRVFYLGNVSVGAPRAASAQAVVEWQPLSEDDPWFVQTRQARPRTLQSQTNAPCKVEQEQRAGRGLTVLTLIGGGGAPDKTMLPHIVLGQLSAQRMVPHCPDMSASRPAQWRNHE